MGLIIKDSRGRLIDERKYIAVMLEDNNSPNVTVNGVAVCGVYVDKHWFIVASFSADEKNFPPIGPMTEDQARVYLRLRQ